MKVKMLTALYVQSQRKFLQHDVNEVTDKMNRKLLECKGVANEVKTRILTYCQLTKSLTEQTVPIVYSTDWCRMN